MTTKTINVQIKVPQGKVCSIQDKFKCENLFVESDTHGEYHHCIFSPSKGLMRKVTVDWKSVTYKCPECLSK